MWQEAAIRIDLRRWEWENLIFEGRLCQALETAQEESHVAYGRFDIGVRWDDDEDHSFGQRLCRRSNCERARRARRARDPGQTPAESGGGEHLEEKGPKRK